MLKNLSPKDREIVQSKIFAKPANESVKREVLLMLTKYDLDNDILISYLLNRVNDKVLSPDTVEFLVTYRDNTISRNSEKQQVKPKKAAKETKQKSKTSEKQIEFGPIKLEKTFTYSFDHDQKTYATVETLYDARDPINVVFKLIVTKWCKYSDFENSIGQDKQLLEDWNKELIKMFNGYGRKFGWEGEWKTNDNGDIVVHLKPSSDWDGKNIPSNIKPWSV